MSQSDVALYPRAILALCAGIGGLELGVKLATGYAARTACICEGEIYCASVLRARQKDGAIDDCPIWSDVKTFDGKPWRGKVDCITAGWPCQPFSHAGKRKGHDDPRHLWPAIAAIIRDVEPRWVFGENVSGHVTLGLDQVCEDLEGLGYRVEAGLFSAQEVGAPHIRQRLFLLAHANSGAIWHAKGINRQGGLQAEPQYDGGKKSVADTSSSRQPEGQQTTRGTLWHGSGRQKFKRRGDDVANADDEGQLQQEGAIDAQRRRPCDGGGIASTRRTFCCVGHSADGLPAGLDQPWAHGWEDGVPRVAEGQEHRADRLRALGNAVVPATAKLAFETLFARHKLR